MDPERLDDRLKRLEDERLEADRAYNDQLTAVDHALLRRPEFPHPPPPYDDAKLADLNRTWDILPDGSPGAGTSLKDRLRTFIWRLVGPPLTRQREFNAALVDHLNRNVAAHQEAERAIGSAMALQRAQTEALLHFQAQLLTLLQTLTLYVDTKDRSVGGRIHVLNAALSGLTDDWMKHWETARAREERFEASHPALLRAYQELSQKVSLAQQTSLLLKREVERLLSAPRTTGAEAAGTPVADAAPHHPSSPSTDLDSFKYVGFEDRFRGAQADIGARLADYVPLFAGRRNVLDIGCGRGELLDLLREGGIGARGIDINASMVEVCRERGLTADLAGGVEYLEQLPDGSLDGLIAIQVVEHLEPAYLSRLIDVAFHKLSAGSPLVFETINPACWVAFFESYLRDVTHRWPLHPDTLKYFAQAGGFSHVTVQYRSPVADADRLQHIPLLPAREGKAHNPVLVDLVDIVNSHVDKLNARLFTFMDYALIARK